MVSRFSELFTQRIKRGLVRGPNKNLFKDVAGDLLVKLGYEKGNDW